MGGRGAPVSPRLHDVFWNRQDVHRALAARDFGVLFRLVSKYAGASQTQIAIAVGMTQGQVSAIMAGDRRITTRRELPLEPRVAGIDDEGHVAGRPVDDLAKQAGEHLR